MSVQPNQTIKSIDGNLFGQVIWTVNLPGSDVNYNTWADRPTLINALSNATTFYVQDLEAGTHQSRLITSDWAAATGVMSVVVLGAYLYALLIDSNGAGADVYRVYRYDRTNLAGGGTLMTFSGAFVLTTPAGSPSIRMTTDGTNFFFTYKAGNSTNDYDIAKYTISGTAYTYVSTTAFGSTAGRFSAFAGRTNGDFIAYASQVFRRYNSSGTLQATGQTLASTNNQGGLSYYNDYFLYTHFSNNSVDGTATTVRGMFRVTIP